MHKLGHRAGADSQIKTTERNPLEMQDSTIRSVGPSEAANKLMQMGQNQVPWKQPSELEEAPLDQEETNGEGYKDSCDIDELGNENEEEVPLENTQDVGGGGLGGMVTKVEQDPEGGNLHQHHFQ